MERTFAIEVTCNLDHFEDLDFDDRSDDGEPLNTGTHLITLTDIPDDATEADLENAASWHFHNTVPISCLDDFMILYRPAAQADIDLSETMNDLGKMKFLRIEGDDPGPD